jgi:hypothetical protein
MSGYGNMNDSGAAAQVLLEDTFDAGFNQQTWFVKPFDPDGSTYIDGTQLRVYPYEPPVHDGYLDLIGSTFNPSASHPGDSYYGSQIISVPQFAPTTDKAVKFTTRARFVPPIGQTTVPGGFIGSMFVYHLVTSNTRDEADVEVLTKSQSEGPGFLTNSFVADPFSASGDVQFVSVPSFDLRDFHEYSFIWAVDSITWYLDGQEVRRETDSVPTTSMQLYFNVWAPLFGGFTRALDPALQPASSAAENIDVIWQLDFARVESTAPPLPGDYNHNNVVDAADYVLWRKSPSTYGGNPAGYTTWRSHFGQSPGSGSGLNANTAVPEPSTFLLLTFGVAGWCRRRRRAA